MHIIYLHPNPVRWVAFTVSCKRVSKCKTGAGATLRMSTVCILCFICVSQFQNLPSRCAPDVLHVSI